VQYTYLSKALNDDSTHLNEDHLFVITRALEFFPEETEFLILQRAHATARDPERKTYLERKIRQQRRAHKLNADDQVMTSDKLSDQIRYLFEPLAQVVHMALDLKHFADDPRRLLAPLQINLDQLKEILRVLSRNEYIELEPDGLGIRKVTPGAIHFGPEHVLMRANLALTKSQMLARIARTPDADKYGFNVTFTMDQASFVKVREEFQSFLKRVEKIAQGARNEHVFQMSFDLFKWL
jgi:hypothetical protein